MTQKADNPSYRLDDQGRLEVQQPDGSWMQAPPMRTGLTFHRILTESELIDVLKKELERQESETLLYVKSRHDQHIMLLDGDIDLQKLAQAIKAASEMELINYD